MNMRKALSAAMLIALGGYAAPASALTTVLGDLTLLEGGALVGNVFGAGDYLSSFSDEYVFDLGTASQSVGTTVTISLNAGPLSFQLGNMEIKLTDSTGSTVYAADNTLGGSNALQVLQVSATLDAGSGYRFWVTGDVTGNAGGAYGGVLAALPVPEADTYAMMLAGLGLMGFLTRRRSNAAP